MLFKDYDLIYGFDLTRDTAVARKWFIGGHLGSL